MFKSKQKTAKYAWTHGFLGFLGCLGFRYFENHDPSYLVYFSAFSMFAFFLTGKLAAQMQDERMKENHKKALLLALKIPLLTLMIVGILPTFATLTEITAVVICMVGFVVTTFTYAISFYCFDKN
jgi:protein-S-isoprenylcysteine O-methyltransferase Ste14